MSAFLPDGFRRLFLTATLLPLVGMTLAGLSPAIAPLPAKPTPKALPAASVAHPAATAQATATNKSAVAPTAVNTLRLEQKRFPQGLLYTVQMTPVMPYQVAPVMSKTLATVDSPLWGKVSKGKAPVFILNGGYFDPANSLTTSYIFEGGVLTGDPRLNPQLVNNPKLAPYLPQIFDRSEFRVYLCQNGAGQFQTRYDITAHGAPNPPSCLLQDSLGAGPVLLPTVNDFAEGFVDYGPNHKVVRDPIGVCARNARSAVGITANGGVILMMGAQDPQAPKASGFTLADMAGLLKARGAVKALSLDGGSSASLLFEGKPVFGKRDANGQAIKRPVKSVLMVSPR